MKRVPNWEVALGEWQETAATRAFAWGEWDCAMASCSAVLALTGADPGMAFRGTYCTEVEALKLLGITGGLGEFVAFIAQGCGMAEVPPLFAHRGDAVLVDNGNPSHALGIVDLSGRFAWCVLEHGMVRIPMGRWLRAWRVG
jgi:hypothetical protein